MTTPIKSRYRKKWTKKEEQILRDNYNILPKKELAELLGRKLKSIHDKASQLKINQSKQWTDEQLAYLIQNYKQLTYKKIGQDIGKTTKAILQKLYVLGLELKREDYWSEAEIEWLKERYTKSIGKRDLNLKEISQKLNRDPSNICRKAKELGLNVYYGREMTEEQKNILSKQKKEWLANNPHPKGMLGKHHSQEFKINQIKRQTGKKLNLTEEERQRRAEQARINIRKLMQEGNMYSRTKSGKRADLNNQFFRSKWEANYARHLNYNNIKWKYEPKEFIFKDEIKGAKSYIPDFYLFELDEWHEVKGWLDAKSKSKLRKFKKYYPEEFKKLTVIIDKIGKIEQKTTLDWLELLGVQHYIFYNNLSKYDSKKIPNWEK